MVSLGRCCLPVLLAPLVLLLLLLSLLLSCTLCVFMPATLCPADDEDDVQIQRQIERQARQREAIAEDEGAPACSRAWRRAVGNCRSCSGRRPAVYVSCPQHVRDLR